MKDHGEHSLATPLASTSHILSRSGTDAVEIGLLQDSKRKRSFMPFPLHEGHLHQQPLSEIKTLSVMYPYHILGFLNTCLYAGFCTPSVFCIMYLSLSDFISLLCGLGARI